jgi:hypothetical protein
MNYNPIASNDLRQIDSEDTKAVYGNESGGTVV